MLPILMALVALNMSDDDGATASSKVKINGSGYRFHRGALSIKPPPPPTPLKDLEE